VTDKQTNVLTAHTTPSAYASNGKMSEYILLPKFTSSHKYGVIDGLID